MAAISGLIRWTRLPQATGATPKNEAPLRTMANALLIASLVVGLAIYALIVYAISLHEVPIALAALIAIVPGIIITLGLVAIVIGGLALVSYAMSSRDGQAG